MSRRRTAQTPPGADWVARLVAWYRVARRPMPWRDDPSPYRVWVSEIMLQQTQVATVIPYFNRFIEHFPDICALAAADLQDVLKVWEGLGYYSRARNLHRAATYLAREQAGQLPNNPEILRKLPGFGVYTTAAVASIAFGLPLPVVDGNVLRVFARFWALDSDITRPRTRREMSQRLESHIRQSDPSLFNQAIMELGALVCRPTQPKCTECPLAAECRALALNRVGELPFKPKRAPVATVTIAVALIRKNKRILVGKRPENKMLGGLWELPGGKLQPGESPQQALVREVREETGLDVTTGESLGVIRHTYSHFKLVMHAFSCEVIRGRARAHACDELRWVNEDQLHTLPFPRATLKLFERLGVKATKPPTASGGE